MKSTPNLEQNKPESAKDSLLLRHFGGNSAAVDTFRKQMDQRELARLRQAIARGAEMDRPAETVAPPAAPAIDKARLAAWIKGELGKLRGEMQETIRAEVAEARQAIEVQVAEAIEERFVSMEDRTP